MADADAVREPGLPAALPAGPPAALSAPAEASVMSLADHLGELRTRIFKTIAAVLAFGAIGYWRSGAIIDLLRSPIGDRKLVSLSAGGPFFLYLKVALVVGIILGMPRSEEHTSELQSRE